MQLGNTVGLAVLCILVYELLLLAGKQLLIRLSLLSKLDELFVVPNLINLVLRDRLRSLHTYWLSSHLLVRQVLHIKGGSLPLGPDISDGGRSFLV